MSYFTAGIAGAFSLVGLEGVLVAGWYDFSLRLL
jgi:hypothetical protein